MFEFTNFKKWAQINPKENIKKKSPTFPKS
jgi:hypothetical protein